MERPNAPEGWEVDAWIYQGDLPSNYALVDDDREVVFSVSRGHREREDIVFLEVEAGDPDFTPIRNSFNVRRTGGREGYSGESLEPKISTVQEGVDFCLGVATRYMNTPIDEIPGAREGFLNR